jgi:hypothetical protein
MAVPKAGSDVWVCIQCLITSIMTTTVCECGFSRVSTLLIPTQDYIL